MQQTQTHQATVNLAPLFNPEEGKTVISPLGNETGFWAGAPTVLFDEKDETFYLYYRLRNPRGLGENERGFEVRIASSKDGENFTDVWSVHKRELDSSSIERSALVKVNDDLYRLYISYVDPADNRWRIDVVEAKTPSSFQVENRKKVLTARDLPQSEGVKDPYIVKHEDKYYMYFVYAKGLKTAASEEMHQTGDVHNTGLAVAPTGLAISEDGIDFKWVDTVIPVSDAGWDQYQSRLTTIIPTQHGYTVLWDGSVGVEQNYEEKVAQAVTFDLRTFAKLNVEGPVLETATGKAVRYVDAIVHEGAVWYYYEYTREDGAHELRLCKVKI
ncbi:hypothetical protein [Fictibacillus phosphorivorans]|uniref:hypothetical protein n=1 Tax=Fictibacillus phosphorivorans TaxID=1221500 RepID=UPI00203D22FF|nr:hypothetical protein [Fictibacillus phosphorivorans]MCM3720215.1 hypothetical protein [Fictibacillus phosphorivorans]MCM3777898.1 hypothetical protein [Fictibacillus phosphorivorans]